MRRLARVAAAVLLPWIALEVLLRLIGYQPPDNRTRLALFPRFPSFYEPDRDLGEENGAEATDAPSENGAEAAPKKRRRGTRGGKGRKRKPAAAGAAAATAEENGQGGEPEPSNETAEQWGYTPMSEWGDLDARDG